jgi:hypothetical protein
MKTIIIFIRSPCKHSNQGLQPLTVNHFQDYYFNCKPKSGLSIFAVNLYQDETLLTLEVFASHLPHIYNAKLLYQNYIYLCHTYYMA